MSKGHHSLNGISCDKMSTSFVAAKTHSYKYKMGFDPVVVYLPQYVDAQSRTGKRHKTSEAFSTFKVRIKLKKYSMEEYNSILAAQK